MDCKKLSVARERLLDPGASEWGSVAAEALKMDATPLANQPSEYIKASRDEKKIGKVRSLSVQSAHNGTDIFVRLSWEDGEKDVEVTDTDKFPDGCGVMMPLKGGDSPIDEMGSKDWPVNAWFWRANFDDKPKNAIAEGLGTSMFTKQCAVAAKSAWVGGKWAVVFSRPLSAAKEENTPLSPGATVKIGFAVWEGSNGERGGVKSFSKEWRDLKLEA